jgi:hypothetical protein
LVQSVPNPLVVISYFFLLWAFCSKSKIYHLIHIQAKISSKSYTHYSIERTSVPTLAFKSFSFYCTSTLIISLQCILASAACDIIFNLLWSSHSQRLCMAHNSV